MGYLRLYLVTRNPHKVLEANEALKGYPVIVEHLDMDKVEIQADDTREIALHAAKTAYRETGLMVAVDDTGLYIDALRGFPGPYAEYVYRTVGLGGVLKLLDGVADRRACFKTSLAVVGPGVEEVFEGVTCGVIALEPRGSAGFGYDPIFIPEGYNVTYAEMSIQEKTRVSHRGKAFRMLGEWARRIVGGQGG